MELDCDIIKYVIPSLCCPEILPQFHPADCPPFLPGEMQNPEAADQSAALEGNGDDYRGEDDDGDDDACSQQSYHIGGREVTSHAVRVDPESDQLMQDEFCPTEVPSTHDESYEDLDDEPRFSILNWHVFSKIVPLRGFAFKNFGT